MKVLHGRDPRFVTQLKWTALQDLPETEYAAIIRRAFAFINLSRAEGLPCSLLEAMRCNTLVAGYNSIGGQRELIGAGVKQNAILAETLDYPTLAAKLEPVLIDLLNGDVSRYAPILQNAFTTAAAYDWEAEESSILEMWREILASGPNQ
ncbi:MAG: glycosyltransferase [Tepidisphaeraceae bacterium]|jgi:glycosyltransferase involved in cell wall biosynthesis